MENQAINEILDSFPKYSVTEDPFILVYTGVIITIICGIWFARVMQLKLINWENNRISPNPLKGVNTVLSWSGSFLGLTLFFTGMLEIFDFNTIKSLISSILISLLSGYTMWGVIKDLMIQLESGSVKEIDEYF